MRTIHKYHLVNFPASSYVIVQGFVRWLAVGAEGNDVVAWAEVNLDDPTKSDLSVVTAWTGQPMHGHNLPYFGTVRTDDELVHHIYMEGVK